MGVHASWQNFQSWQKGLYYPLYMPLKNENSLQFFIFSRQSSKALKYVARKAVSVEACKKQMKPPMMRVGGGVKTNVECNLVA